MLVLLAYAQTPPLHAGVSSGARGLKFGLSLHLHQYPYCVHASSKVSMVASASLRSSEVTQCSVRLEIEGLLVRRSLASLCFVLAQDS